MAKTEVEIYKNVLKYLPELNKSKDKVIALTHYLQAVEELVQGDYIKDEALKQLTATIFKVQKQLNKAQEDYSISIAKLNDIAKGANIPETTESSDNSLINWLEVK